MPLSKERKVEYFARMEKLITDYTRVFIVGADNVGSNQFQQIRIKLRGKAIVLMGKNTMMRKVIKDFLEKNPSHPVEALLPTLKGNVGFVFTNEDLSEVRDSLVANRVPAPARTGTVAPVDVIVPAGPTGCEPGMTSFFQALQIMTKIQKGQIEITNDVHLIKAGGVVEAGQVALLAKLNILPFTYGLVVLQVYDSGALFDPKVLDLKDDILAAKFAAGAKKIAAISLQIGYPTLASLPFSIQRAFSKILGIALVTDYSFKHAEKFKDALANPEKYASAGGAAPAAAAAAPKVEEKKKEEVVEEFQGAGGLFGDDDGY